MSGASVAVVVLAGALAVDVLLGDPPNRWHPVAWLGRAIGAARRTLAHGSPLRLLVAGAALTIGIAVAAALAGALVARASVALGTAGLVVEAVALSLCLSIRGLWRAAREVGRALERGDLPAARAALAFHLVSRPTGALSAGEVAAATVESVAENLTDSIVAPALLYLAFGLPGAALYRAVNTADAMLGYREGVLEHFGKLAARADDVLNLVPARLAGLAIVVAAALAGGSPRGALRVMWRDHHRTASPNAGWTMAAMAGALGVRVTKRGAYALGDGALPEPADVARSLRVMAVAVVIALGMPILLLIINGL
ncbi:MAG TPA: adenosylcobinamide-phosphate synthase CbiB [Terriglobales bacterium]|nr:adenosylcobinamide-phosphate synthase CbiB [Terriglobales bacterium]